MKLFSKIKMIRTIVLRRVIMILLTLLFIIKEDFCFTNASNQNHYLNSRLTTIKSRRDSTASFYANQPILFSANQAPNTPPTSLLATGTAASSFASNANVNDHHNNDDDADDGEQTLIATVNNSTAQAQLLFSRLAAKHLQQQNAANKRLSSSHFNNNQLHHNNNQLHQGKSLREEKETLCIFD